MAVTARIGGSDAGVFSWLIEYDDVTRNVTASSTGTGFCLVTVEVTATITRTVAFFPAAGALSNDLDLRALMAAADFAVISGAGPQVLVSGVPPAQVRRIVGKAGQQVGGLTSTSRWSRE